MRLSGLAMLASDTARSKAYIQAMIKHDIFPELCVVYSDDLKAMRKEADAYKDNGDGAIYFDVSIPLLTSIEKAGIEYITLDDRDINSERMRCLIADMDQKYLIYSGYGAYILRRPLFQLGKRFIHVHAGILPQYRGSTTAYFSYLQDGYFGASAIFLTEGIDEGEVIAQRTFAPPRDGVSVDHIYEPWTRSQVLTDVLRLYEKHGELSGKAQDGSDVQTYYIIHPVLKHIALLKMEGQTS